MRNGRSWCSYKEFVACKLKGFDGKSGAIAYTHWVEKIEVVHDISGCGVNQKVKYAVGSLIGIDERIILSKQGNAEVRNGVLGLRYGWSWYIYGLAPQIRGIVAATEPPTIHNAILNVGVLTNEAVRNGSLKKSGE
ncbi:hypothetical protein Tco_0553352 [Tanacetum coccineum]